MAAGGGERGAAVAVGEAGSFPYSDSTRSLRFRGDHAALAGVVEEAAGVDDGADFAERLERVGGAVDGQRVDVENELADVAGLHFFAEALGGVVRVKFAGGDAVAEEDAREGFGDDGFDARRAHRDRRVFAR